MDELDIDWDDIDSGTCRACEAEFIVILADDLLEADHAICPLCSEPMMD